MLKYQDGIWQWDHKKCFFCGGVVSLNSNISSSMQPYPIKCSINSTLSHFCPSYLQILLKFASGCKWLANSLWVSFHRWIELVIHCFYEEILLKTDRYSGSVLSIFESALIVLMLILKWLETFRNPIPKLWWSIITSQISWDKRICRYQNTTFASKY